MPLPHRASLLAAAALCLLSAGQSGVHAAPAAPPAAASAPVPAPSGEPAKPAPYRSNMTADVMYLVLVGELSANNGDATTASELLLEAARRSKDDAVFQRAVKLATDAGDGERALAAARAWRAASPQSREAAQYAMLILLRLNRVEEAAEPLRAVVTLTPAPQRAKVVAALPVMLAQLPDKRSTATLIDKALQPLRADPGLAAAVPAASARAHKDAGDMQQALALVKEALAKDPQNEPAALLAIDLISTQPEAEALVQRHVATGKPTILVRQAYAQRLAQASRMTEAATQIEAVTKESPELARPWLFLGLLRMEVHEYDAAEAALKRFLDLQAKPAAQAATSAPAKEEEEDEQAAADGDADDVPTAVVAADSGSAAQVTQALVLLAQIAEERGRLDQAQAWLDKIPEGSANTLAVQLRRANLLVRKGRIDEARALLHQAPAANDEEARARLVAEALMLRDADHYKESYAVLADATKRFPDDTDLLYQQSMIAEKLKMYDEMERILRRVIELDRDHYNAHNALGFSLADRNLRLPEARQLIQRALDLSPGDPYIIDSLAWVEFRQGNAAEALKLLRQAFQARQDPEIAAHLGEVLWTQGERDEARRIWRSAQAQNKGNSTLQDTLKRLRVGL